MSSAISWKKVEVVRPQPGHAETCGVKLRRPSDWSTCWATCTSSVRSPPGRGVRDTRIVSPMPSCKRIDRPAVRSEEHTSELQSQSNLVCRLLLEKKKNTKGYIENISSCHGACMKAIRTARSE